MFSPNRGGDTLFDKISRTRYFYFSIHRAKSSGRDSNATSCVDSHNCGESGWSLGSCFGKPINALGFHRRAHTRVASYVGRCKLEPAISTGNLRENGSKETMMANKAPLCERVFY